MFNVAQRTNGVLMMPARVTVVVGGSHLFDRHQSALNFDVEKAWHSHLTNVTHRHLQFSSQLGADSEQLCSFSILDHVIIINDDDIK